MSHPPNQPPYPPQPGPQHDPWQDAGRIPPPPTGFGLPVPGAPPPPRKRNNTPLIIGLVAGALVLVLGCCGVLAAIGSQEDDPQASAETGTPAVAVVSPSAPAATTAAAKPAPTTASPAAPAVKTVAMPKVTGKNAAVADDELRRLGFTNVRYGSQDENDTVVLLLSNWTVTKQSTKAGTKVKVDTLIVLTCTKES